MIVSYIAVYGGEMDAIFALFDGDDAKSEPVFRPAAGTTYVYTWESDDRKDD